MSMDVRSLIAASTAQERRLEVLANNLANVNTVGFKARRPVFSLLPLADGTAGQAAPVQLAFLGESALPEGAERLQFGLGLQMTGVKTNFEAGDILMTGNPLDLALSTPGFFVIQTPQGLRFTRNGSFTLNSEKVLVNQDGYPVMGQRGPITVEGNRVMVEQSGKLTVDGREADALRVVDFKNRDRALRKDLGGLFINAPGIEPQDPERVEVRSGALERSNVSPVPSLTEMIEVLRAFEAYNKVIQTLNEATQRATTEVGRLR